MDKLDKLFELQRNLQERLGNNMYVQSFRTEMCLALIDEVLEALRETPWKSWKKSASYNKEKFREELIDAWHFLINLSLAAELSPTMLYDDFIIKNSENHARQDRGY